MRLHIFSYSRYLRSFDYHTLLIVVSLTMDHLTSVPFVFVFESCGCLFICEFLYNVCMCWLQTFAVRTVALTTICIAGTRYGASLRKQIKKMEVSQHSKFFCEFCGKVMIWAILPFLFSNIFIELGYIACIQCGKLSTVTVCSEEKGCGYLGMQRLWQSESWWCLHLEVRSFSNSI